jgi:hypothetical protein
VRRSTHSAAAPSRSGTRISSKSTTAVPTSSTSLPTAYPEYFNSNHEENAFDNRSDNKGPEPEGVTVAKLWGRNYAFIGLERIGGVMVYDVTNPCADFYSVLQQPRFWCRAGYAEAGDLGAEGLTVIEPWKSPIPVCPCWSSRTRSAERRRSSASSGSGGKTSRLCPILSAPVIVAGDDHPHPSAHRASEPRRDPRRSGGVGRKPVLRRPALPA